MTITRNDLIKICDDFLDDKIKKEDIANYAWEAISNDDIEFEDDIVSDVIFSWDNEVIDFEIDKVNMNLWKNKIMTGIDRLLEHNSWNFHIESQKNICTKYNSEWRPINKKLNIGISDDYVLQPINGLRHTDEKGTTGWFIWFGEYSEDENFFKPICAEHLLKINPEIIKYLGLEIGFRFLIDKNGYEDVWKDENVT